MMHYLVAQLRLEDGSIRYHSEANVNKDYLCDQFFEIVENDRRCQRIELTDEHGILYMFGGCVVEPCPPTSGQVILGQ